MGFYSPDPSPSPGLFLGPRIPVNPHRRDQPRAARLEFQEKPTMSHTSTSARRSAVQAAVLAIAALGLPGAQAAIGSPGSTTAAGGLSDLTYGLTGDIYQLDPYLYIQGLGSPGAPPTVTVLNPSLSFEYVIAGLGTSLATITYTVHNGSASTTFNDLRFWVVVNPDGDPALFSDQVTQHWGAATSSGPVARQVQEFDFDPFNGIGSKAIGNKGLTDGAPSGNCASAIGCDTVFALQWNTPTLAAGQDFQVTIGLSDNGSTLGSRYLTATSTEGLGTALTFSGVAAIPEPSTWAMLMSGVAGMIGIVARRRRHDQA
jgi:hypothetical protein